MDEKKLKVETQFINRVVAIILATGMYTTIAFYLIGLILMFAKGRQIPSMSEQYFHSFGAFFASLFSLDARAFLYLGTVSLIMTPVSRVLISIIAFWKEKDFKYVGVTAIVFLVIAISVIIGSVFKVNVG
jgi:uncharacterized membrane protein